MKSNVTACGTGPSGMSFSGRPVKVPASLRGTVESSGGMMLPVFDDRTNPATEATRPADSSSGLQVRSVVVAERRAALAAAGRMQTRTSNTRSSLRLRQRQAGSG